MILAPSILSADFANLQRDIESVDKAGAQYIHIDVMDGHFVPNITFGPDMVKCIRKITDKILDVHLMVEYPEKFINAFIDAGADIINVHYESKMDFDNVYETVKSAGKKLAMTINPETDCECIKEYLPKLDMVLVMSVHPGYGGQKFISLSIDKLQQLRRWDANIDIQVDGGINVDNVTEVVKAGANIVVAGSAIFGAFDIESVCKEFLNRGNIN